PHTMPPWRTWVSVFYMKTLSPPATQPTTTAATATAAAAAAATATPLPATADADLTVAVTTQNMAANFNMSRIFIPAMADDMTIVLIIGLIILAVLLLTITGILLMCFLRKGDPYPMGKGEDVELKEPLHPNHTTPSSPPLIPTNNHMATFDEFSAITNMLNNGVDIPAKDHCYDPANRYSSSTIPWIDDDQNLTHPIYNRNKKRPASSISEVLEELDRIKKAKELGVDPDADVSIALHPRTDGIMEESVDSRTTTRSLNHSGTVDSLTSHDEGRRSIQDHNGDSGYEASSSKPEVDDDDDDDDDDDIGVNTADTISPDSPQQQVRVVMRKKKPHTYLDSPDDEATLDGPHDRNYGRRGHSHSHSHNHNHDHSRSRSGSGGSGSGSGGSGGPKDKGRSGGGSSVGGGGGGGGGSGVGGGVDGLESNLEASAHMTDSKQRLLQQNGEVNV
ncbi:hypothetical protein Ahia01_000746700, partial [Argonauta hians]